MAWPPPVLPINRTNAEPQQDTHPSDHNQLALAINDTVGYLQTNYGYPAGYREALGISGVTIPTGAWTFLATPTLGISGGVGFTNDASSIIANVPGLYDVEVAVSIQGQNPNGAGRRGVGYSFATGTVPTAYQFQYYAAPNAGAVSTVQFRTHVQVVAPTGSRIALWVAHESVASITTVGARVFARRIG